MVRLLRGALFVAVVGGVSAVGAVASAADEPAKCTVATKGDSPVAKACTTGGIKEAKKVMKDMTKKAKANGVKFDCDDCHKDDANYALTDDAGDKFKKMVAALAPKK
jgi:hypothetical protein